MMSEKRGKKFCGEKQYNFHALSCLPLFFIQLKRVSLCNLRQVQRKSVHANICTYIHIQRDSANQGLLHVFFSQLSDAVFLGNASITIQTTYTPKKKYNGEATT